MNTQKNTKKDGLGDRMKAYENVTRTHLMPRSYTVCRIDGRAFHSYLRGSKKPFDGGVMSDMDNTAIYLCENVQNAKLGYVQSDEITILLCDFDTLTTTQFFDGNIQKMSSVIASMATAKFNQLRFKRSTSEGKSPLWNYDDVKLAEFDCRVWNVPTQWETVNTFIWRNQDCSRNSVSMVAQANFSHKELQGKSTTTMHEMLHQKGVNWATDFPDGAKNGRLIVKEMYETSLPGGSNCSGQEPSKVIRSKWASKGAWKFTEDMLKLKALIPVYE